MNNDQFLQYYLEKQAARKTLWTRLRRERNAANKLNSTPRPSSPPSRQVSEQNSTPRPSSPPSRQVSEQNSTPRPSSPPSRQPQDLGIGGTTGKGSTPDVAPSRQVQEPNFVLKGEPQTTFQATRPVREGAVEPGFPMVAAGPRKDVTPLGYKVNRMNAWVKRNKVPLAWGGAGTAAAAALGTAGYMMSGDDAAPTPVTAAKTTDPNAAPEANTPKQEDNESWWADVLAWIKENPELAMLVLGGGGLGIGALLGSR